MQLYISYYFLLIPLPSLDEKITRIQCSTYTATISVTISLYCIGYFGGRYGDNNNNNDDCDWTMTPGGLVDINHVLFIFCTMMIVY